MFTTCLDKIRNRIIGSHIVIYHHTTGIDTCTDTVIENQGDACINQSLIMIIVLGVFGLRHNDPTNLVAQEIFTDTDFALILFATQSHHDTIATGSRSLLNTCQDG